MKKISYKEMSEKKCHKCFKPIKMNVVMRKPDANIYLCYRCFKSQKLNPAK